MSTRTTVSAPSKPRSLARILRARRSAVFLPGPDPLPGNDRERNDGVTALECDLVDRGFLVGAPLRAALVALSEADLVLAGAALLADIDDALGADR
jgi:hypothetical protein